MENKINEAKKISIEERQKQIQKCGEKIGKILEEEGCSLECSMLITSNGVIPRINIIIKK